MTTHHLALLPRDGLFCKDGRGWATSARGHALDWPWPTTVRGALTTAFGRGTETRDRPPMAAQQWLEFQKQIVISGIVALRRIHGDAFSLDCRMWPTPTDALWLESEKVETQRQEQEQANCAKVLRLEPQPISPGSWRTLGPQISANFDAAREALWVPQNVGTNAKPLGSPRWLCEADFVRWLCGEQIFFNPKSKVVDQYSKPAMRQQTHVGIRPASLTADDGILFLHDVVETLDMHSEWAVGVRVTGPEPKPTSARLGSDGRIANVEKIGDEIFAMPPALRAAFETGTNGLRLVVVTPTEFTCGWLPDGFGCNEKAEIVGKLPGSDEPVILRAACVPRPMHVSGWDVAKGEKGARKTSRLVPPGTVYFFEREKKQPFTAGDAEKLWLAALGCAVPGGCTKESGFGCVVPGVWKPTTSTDRANTT